MARIVLTAWSVGTPRRSSPTSTLTKTSHGPAAASEYARAESRSTRVGTRPWARASAAATGSEFGYTRIGAVIPRWRIRMPSVRSATAR